MIWVIHFINSIIISISLLNVVHSCLYIAYIIENNLFLLYNITEIKKK